MLTEKMDMWHLEARSFKEMHLNLKAHIEEYIFFLGGAGSEKDDFAQEILIKLWLNWTKLKNLNSAELKDYVFIMTRNYLINARKKNSRPKWNKVQLVNDYERVVCMGEIDDSILILEGLQVYRKAIDQLHGCERQAYLHHIEGYTAEEIALMLGKAQSTVRNQLATATKTVRSYLNQVYDLNLCEPGQRRCNRYGSLN